MESALGGVVESGVWGGVGAGSCGGVPGAGPVCDPVGSLGVCVLAGCPLGSESAGVVGVGCAVGRVGSGGVGEGAVEFWGSDAGVDGAGSCATTAIVIKVSKLREIRDLRNSIEHPTEPHRLERLYPRLHAGTEGEIASYFDAI